ncbi:MAG: hypothetical protein R3A78_09140 [Polyangiales bacterium]
MRVLAPCLFLCAALAATARSSTAYADDRDGLYGRFDGDLTLSAGLGGGAALPTGTDAQGTAVLELRARYLDTAGLLVMPEWRVGEFGAVTFALDLRPLFPARFLLNHAVRRAWIDLLIDSIGVDAGVAILPLGEGHDAGAALSIGFGADVPLLLPGTFAHGLFLRLWARHLSSTAGAASGPGGGAHLGEWTLGATLTARFTANAGLAAVPRGPRARSTVGRRRFF